MLQTRYKAKLPKGYSYPVGAQTLSEALQGIAQFSAITLRFHRREEYFASDYQKTLKAGGDITVLQAGYSPYSEWYIYIYAVPSSLKHQVAQEMADKALPALKDSYQHLDTVAPNDHFFKATVSLSSGQVQIDS